MVRHKHPALGFDVEDATGLKYGDDVFDVVISGGCLLHIPNFQTTLAETAKVARCYAPSAGRLCCWDNPMPTTASRLRCLDFRNSLQ